MDLYIYNPKIEGLGVVDTFSSFRWRRKFFEPGEFELHCKASTENLTLLRPGNIIHRLDRKEAGIIEGITIGAPDKGTSEEITATGRMGSSMLDRRIITPTINFSGTVEDAMRKIITENRPPSNLVFGTAGGYSASCTFQATGKGALAVCTALAKAAPLGFRCRLDVPGKRWIFEVYDGVDRSVTQHDRPYVLFSGEYENIDGPKYETNTTGYANYAYVAGQGEGSARIVVTVDQTGGEPRRELWVDARDLQQADGQTDADYRAQLIQRGTEKLAEAARVENFSAAAVDTANFEYLTDWNLGDIVSFEKWNILLNQRITEVEEIYENGIETVTPVCGTPLPETLDLGSDT